MARGEEGGDKDRILREKGSPSQGDQECVKVHSTCRGSLSFNFIHQMFRTLDDAFSGSHGNAHAASQDSTRKELQLRQYVAYPGSIA